MKCIALLANDHARCIANQKPVEAGTQKLRKGGGERPTLNVRLSMFNVERWTFFARFPEFLSSGFVTFPRPVNRAKTPPGGLEGAEVAEAVQVALKPTAMRGHKHSRFSLEDTKGAR